MQNMAHNIQEYIHDFTAHLQNLQHIQKKEQIKEITKFSHFDSLQVITQYNTRHGAQQSAQKGQDSQTVAPLQKGENSLHVFIQNTALCSAMLTPLFYDAQKNSRIFGFFGYGDYALITIETEDFMCEQFALQYALSALLSGFSCVVVMIVKCKLETGCYHAILQECGYAHYTCLAHQHIVLEQSRIDTQTKLFSLQNNAYSMLQDSLESNSVLQYESFCTQQLHTALSCALALLEERGSCLEGKFCMLTGCDTLAIESAKALYTLHANPITLSDNEGFIYDEYGLDIGLIESLQNTHKTNWLPLYAKKRKCLFVAEKEQLWEIPAFACFIGHKDSILHRDSIKKLLQNGCKCVVENYPHTHFSAVELLIESRICYVPFILANMGHFLWADMQYKYMQEALPMQDFYHNFHHALMRQLTSIQEVATLLHYPLHIMLGIFGKSSMILHDRLRV